MEYLKKIFLTLITIIGLQPYSHATDVLWLWNAGTIPADGNTYYIDSSNTLTGDLIITGTLEIRAPSGTLTRPTNTNHNLTVAGGYVTVKTGRSINNQTMGTGTGIMTISSGSLAIESGALLNVATVGSGTATVLITGGDVIVNGSIDCGLAIANIQTNGGHLTLNDNALVDLSNGTNHNFEVISGTFSFDNAKFQKQPGIQPKVFGAKILQIAPGLYQGKLDIQSGEIMTIPLGSTLDMMNSSTLTNIGTVNIYGNLSNAGTIDNQTSKTITIKANGTLTHNTPFFTNSGTVTIEGTLLNTGTITGVNGISLSSGGTLSNSGTLTRSSALTIISGATLSNSGTFNSNASLNINSGGIITNSGTFNNNNNLFINSGGSVTNNNLIINNQTFILNQGGIFINNGSFINNGLYLNQAEKELVVQGNQIIPSGTSYTIPTTQTMTVLGTLINESSTTLDVEGKLYTYGTIENGDGTAAGTINVNIPGDLYLLGGTLHNGHVNSLVNVRQGGSLYNYYGTVNLTPGGSDSLDIKAGGRFENIRGNNPGAFTVQPGGQFFDGNEINLTQDLDVDYTWTITNNATINGYGHSINLGPNGKILIAGKTASLLFDGVEIHGVKNNNIACTENTTSVSFNNVLWNQDATYSFTKGSFYIAGEWIINGNDHTFNYESNQTSTIASDAILHLVKGTFNYNSTNYNPSIPNALMMIDSTSKIHLEYARLLATKTYIPTAGSLLVSGLGILECPSALLNLSALNYANIDGSLQRIGNVIA